MLDSKKLEEFKERFEIFKSTEKYKARKRQEEFIPLAKRIIEETLKNDELTNLHLTGFINMFKAKCRVKNFNKYVEQNIQSKILREEFKSIFKRFYETPIDANGRGIRGFVDPFRKSFNEFSQDQLAQVKLILKDAFNAKTENEAKEIALRLAEYHSVNFFLPNVYSPWLHYINPKIFPVNNNKNERFIEWAGISTDYADSINDYQKLKEIVDEDKLGGIDAFSYWFEKPEEENKKQVSMEIKSETKSKGEKKNKHALNQILYGPPGTGKTFFSKDIALQIAENLNEQQLKLKYKTRDELNGAFRKHQKGGQIGFVTFHQSFGYEDFIEGIKPKMVDGEDGETTGDLGQNEQLKYEIKDGIFKIMAERADSYQSFSSESEQLTFDKQIVDNLENKQFFKMSLGNTANEDDQVIYDYCLQNNCIALGWGQDIDYEGVKEEKDIAKLLEDNGGAQSSYEIFAVKCFILWMKVGDIVFISDGNLKARAIGMIDGDYYYDDNSTIYYKHFRKVKWLAKNISIPVDQVYGKQFSQQTIYAMYTHLVKKEFFRNIKPITTTPPNHVLIIDEINRGNIASIFGELITLIEEDKRKGGKEYFPVTLPYSKKPFSVPSNLYIIGTMNTADRSVEALDTALRRRFAFLHMKPEPDKLGETVEGINLNQMLETINKRLEVLLDADHTIGHAWLWDVKDLEGLKTTFKDKILPLLQEFFYNDYEKIGLVLGEQFVNCETVKSSVFADFKKGSGLGGEYEGNFIFSLTDIDKLDAVAFKSIYTKIEKQAE